MSLSENLILTDLYINRNLVDLTSEAGIKECKVCQLSGRLVKRSGEFFFFLKLYLQLAALSQCWI